MILLPAIDIIDGKPVRLVQGDYQRKTQVAGSAVDTACDFAQKGAKWIHMVDLDGAKAGKPVNDKLILEAAKKAGVPVEAGGGIRTMEDIDTYINGGIARVILGSAAVKNPKLIEEAAKKYPGKIAVGIDCKDGFVKISGWLEDGKIKLEDLARQMLETGVDTFIVTNIEKDGTLEGADVELMEHLSKTIPAKWIASGGVKDMEDVRKLNALHIEGAIAGKSLYAKTLDLEEALQYLEENSL
jgi:phosphoribosylformimino-5-aminoimidazole carboxamide ribotide isomerase